MSVRAALVFPGQGSQRPGMLEHVPENEDLDRLLDAAEALSDLNLCEIATDGEAEDLQDTRVAQPLLYLADWAWGVALIESGVEPAAVAGHSLGELAALAVAGVFSVEAGLELVVERSKLMASAAAGNPGGMRAVLGLDGEAVAAAISGIEDVWVANDNAPGQVVISGKNLALDVAGAALTEAGARKIVPLNVAGPFHTPLMEKAADAFSYLVSGAEFSDAVYPVYQNTDPTPTTDAERIRARLIEQIVSPVQWTGTMKTLACDGISLLIEAGPGSVLSGLAKRVEGVEALSAEPAGIERVLEEVCL